MFAQFGSRMDKNRFKFPFFLIFSVLNYMYTILLCDTTVQTSLLSVGPGPSSDLEIRRHVLVHCSTKLDNFSQIMFAMPLISIPIMLQFPCALNVYWLTNNMISLVQSRVMKRPAVKEYLGIGQMTKWKPEDLPATYFHVSTHKSNITQSLPRTLYNDSQLSVVFQVIFRWAPTSTTGFLCPYVCPQLLSVKIHGSNVRQNSKFKDQMSVKIQLDIPP